MIKLDKIGQKAVYFTSPYFEHVSLTAPYIEKVEWNKDGTQGVMYLEKNNNQYKMGLFPNVYTGKENLEMVTKHLVHRTPKRINATLNKVGTKSYRLGFIYNLRQLY